MSIWTDNPAVFVRRAYDGLPVHIALESLDLAEVVRIVQEHVEQAGYFPPSAFCSDPTADDLTSVTFIGVQILKTSDGQFAVANLDQRDYNRSPKPVILFESLVDAASYFVRSTTFGTLGGVELIH